MHNISKNKRRSTRDVDFDFIKYSLNNNSIIDFIEKLNDVDDGVKIIINGDIQELHHQDYNGKRVLVKLVDNNDFQIETKLDIGVHKDFDILQEEYCFHFDSINKSATLLINSKEQIMVEKLKSLMKFTYTSTRYKDIFDFYYLIKYGKLKRKMVNNLIRKMIFEDITINVNNYNDIYVRLSGIFSNKKFIFNLNNSKVNWLDVSIEETIKCIMEYFNNFVLVHE